MIIIFASALIPVYLPYAKASTNEYVDVTAYYYDSAGLKADGSLWVWGGWGDRRRLENESVDDVHTPAKIMDDVKSYSLGEHNHSMVLKTDGSLWGWGAGFNGEFGRGEELWLREPERLMDDVTQVSVGGDFTMAIKTDGNLWAWGFRGFGIAEGRELEESRYPIRVMDLLVESEVSEWYETEVDEEVEDESEMSESTRLLIILLAVFLIPALAAVIVISSVKKGKGDRRVAVAPTGYNPQNYPYQQPETPPPTEAPTPPQTPERHCPQCNSVIYEQDKFCANCGKNLDE